MHLQVKCRLDQALGALKQSDNGVIQFILVLSKYRWVQWFFETRHSFIAVCLIPLLSLIVDILFDNLGSNAIQALHIRLGDWSLRFLGITLTITPIQKLTRWRGMADYRQLFGLYAFFYGTLHILAYMTMDHALVWQIMFIDIIESPYIWFGVFAYVVTFLLAITSPNAAKKRMGKSWKKLHRFIYPASIAVLLHYFWQLKGNMAEPFFYAIILFVLLSFRVAIWYKARQLSRLMIPKGRILEDD
jgi:sulfoxide reductase heme-binding subunit YedZ